MSLLLKMVYMPRCTDRHDVGIIKKKRKVKYILYFTTLDVVNYRTVGF